MKEFGTFLFDVILNSGVPLLDICQIQLDDDNILSCILLFDWVKELFVSIFRCHSSPYFFVKILQWKRKMSFYGISEEFLYHQTS